MCGLPRSSEVLYLQRGPSFVLILGSRLVYATMEQSCYKCGQLVEEGRPFCPHCAAPQIRVVVAETVPAIKPFAEPEGAAQGEAALPASQTVPVLAVPIQWSQSAQPCAIAALIAALSIVLKLMVPVIAAIGAGFLAVAFYRRRNPQIMVGPRQGARLGAICGLFCSGMMAVLLPLRVAVLHEGAEIHDALLEAVRQSAARNSDPQVQAALDFMRSPAGLAFMLALLLILGLVMLVLLGSLGGVLGGAVLGRRDRT